MTSKTKTQKNDIPEPSKNPGPRPVFPPHAIYIDPANKEINLELTLRKAVNDNKLHLVFFGLDFTFVQHYSVELNRIGFALNALEVPYSRGGNDYSIQNGWYSIRQLTPEEKLELFGPQTAAVIEKSVSEVHVSNTVTDMFTGEIREIPDDLSDESAPPEEPPMWEEEEEG